MFIAQEVKVMGSYFAPYISSFSIATDVTLYRGLLSVCNVYTREQFVTQQKDKILSSCCCPFGLGVGYSKCHLHGRPLGPVMHAA